MQYFVQEQLHTIETAADLLKCNERVLREKIKAGTIKGYKKFGKWYVLYSELVTYITSDNENETDNE